MKKLIILFFFNDTATTEIYTLSLHDALPISRGLGRQRGRRSHGSRRRAGRDPCDRSEEHTSELQSRFDLVCRLLLEKKKKNTFSRSYLFNVISNHDNSKIPQHINKHSYYQPI